MRRSGSVRVALLAIGTVVLCLAGQAVAVAPVGAGGAAAAGAPVMASSVPAAPGELAASTTPRGGTWIQVMYEDFESSPWPGTGWSVFDGNGDTGGVVYWDDVTYYCHAGNWCAWPAKGGPDGLTPPAEYRADMDSWMVFGPMDLSAFTAAEMSFWFHNSTKYGDYFYWGASHDGTNFPGMSANGIQEGWRRETLDLSAFAGDSSVWIAFAFQSTEWAVLGQSGGPYVDDISVVGLLPTVPGSFGKFSPGSGASGEYPNPTLTWYGSSGADYYQYCIDVTNDAACDGSWVSTGTSYASLWALSASTTYYWQVRARNAYGTTYANGGTWWSFATGDAPSQFGKAGPANAATAQALDLTLSWGQSEGAYQYQYCLDTNPNPNCDDAWYLPDGGDLGTAVAKTSLMPSTTYYWQVRAISDSGHTYANNGTWWSFRTVGDLPGAFAKSGPAHGSTGQSVAPTLSWGASAEATAYQYCIDTVNDGACAGTWVSAGAATSAVPAALAPSTVHFWQVRATNGFGSAYADSGGWWSFTTGASTPVEGAFRSIGTFDGWTLEQDESAGKGGSFNATAVAARVGDDGSDRQYRAILDFDTSSLPDNAVVTGVTLRIKKQAVAGTNPFTTHGFLLVDVKAGFFHDVEALERFDFQAAGSRGNVGRFIKVADDGWYRAPLRARSFDLVNLTGTTQFRLRFEVDDNDDGGADYLSFFSGEPVNDANRPELIITYYVP